MYRLFHISPCLHEYWEYDVIFKTLQELNLNYDANTAHRQQINAYKTIWVINYTNACNVASSSVPPSQRLPPGPVPFPAVSQCRGQSSSPEHRAPAEFWFPGRRRLPQSCFSPLLLSHHKSHGATQDRSCLLMTFFDILSYVVIPSEFCLKVYFQISICTIC